MPDRDVPPEETARLDLTTADLLALLAGAPRLEMLAALARAEQPADRLAGSLHLTLGQVADHLEALYRHGLVSTARYHGARYYRPTRLVSIRRAGRAVHLEMTTREGDLVSFTMAAPSGRRPARVDDDA